MCLLNLTYIFCSIWDSFMFLRTNTDLITYQSEFIWGISTKLQYGTHLNYLWIHKHLPFSSTTIQNILALWTKAKFISKHVTVINTHTHTHTHLCVYPSFNVWYCSHHTAPVMTTHRVMTFCSGVSLVLQKIKSSLPTYRKVKHSDFMVACIHTGYTVRCIADGKHSSYVSHHG